MSPPRPFHWPDETPSAQAHALGTGVSLGGQPAHEGKTARPWRLRELFRMRPLPLALWMAVGAGSMAFAFVGKDAIEPQWGELLPQFRQQPPSPPSPPPRPDVFQGLPLDTAKAIAQVRRAGGKVVLASDYYATQTAPTRPSTAAPSVSPAQTAVGATDTVLLAAAPRSGMRMRLDSSWQGAREIAEMVNPFASAPRTPALPAKAADATAGGSPALRIAELPDIVGLPLALAVDERNAVPAPGQQPTMLQAAIDQGLTLSPGVKAAQARLASFRHDERAAFGSLLPKAEGRAAIGSGRAEGDQATDARPRRQGSFTVRQTLLDVPAQREVSRQQALAVGAELQWQAEVSEVSAKVAATYLDALHARINLALAQRNMMQLERLLRIVETRTNPASNEAVESHRIQARAADARAQVAQSQTVLRSALRRLHAMTGDRAKALGMAFPESLNIPRDVETARADARRLNRELLAAKADSVAAAYEALGHRARLLPTLELELTHTRATNADGLPGHERDTRGMLILNWQLLNGGSDMARQRAALAREKEREFRAEDLQLRVDQELESAYAALDNVAARFAALREGLIANASVVSGFEHQIANGQRPMLDVLDAYQRLHSNRLELAALVLSEVQNRVQVAHLTGRLGAFSAEASR
jgi:adhesin transport system outer membrane protein